VAKVGERGMDSIDRSVIRCRWYQKVPDFPSFAKFTARVVAGALKSALRARKPNEFLALHSLQHMCTYIKYNHMHLCFMSSLRDLELHLNTDHFCIHMSNDRQHEAKSTAAIHRR
jgi:hypothetical protein